MKKLAISLFAAAALIAGCGSTDDSFVANNNTLQPTTPQGTSLKQIEQLARPGINEALLFTNAFLNTYNAVSPQFVATALANAASPEGQAAAPIFTEATTVLNLIMNAPQVAGLTGLLTTPNQAVAAFLPDVMRVDSSLNILPAQTAYSFKLNAVNSPVSGRKLMDDVIDITYIVLLDATGGVNDHVKYTANTNNPATGHQPLVGTFPYLAPAN
ncbi:DUF4331 family protein [bacterium]|nr:DUF4331 family protein [bacterium]